MAYRYREDENVYRKDGVRFHGDDSRRLLADINGQELLKEILKARCDAGNLTAPFKLVKMVKGVKLEFTHNLLNAKRIYVRRMEDEE